MGSLPRPWCGGPSCFEQHRDTIGVLFFGGVYWDNGKKNGNYNSVVRVEHARRLRHRLKIPQLGPQVEEHEACEPLSKLLVSPL